MEPEGTAWLVGPESRLTFSPRPVNAPSQTVLCRGGATVRLCRIGDETLHQMIACARLRSVSASICNQRLALMKKLARFVRLSAVSCPQLSFGSRELPINNKDAAQLSGREPAAHAFLFSLLAWMACAKEFSNFMPFDVRYKTPCCWGRGQIIAFFRHGSTCFCQSYPVQQERELREVSARGLSRSVFRHQRTRVSV